MQTTHADSSAPRPGSSSAAAAMSGIDALRAGADADRAPALVASLYAIPSGSDGGSSEAGDDLANHFRAFLAEQTRTYVWHSGHPPVVASGHTSGAQAMSPQPLLAIHLLTPIAAPDTDEWFALHLLVLFAATSPLLAGRTLAIQTFDSDGDFLLIQGADELPDWIEPSNAHNRVWLLPQATGRRTASTAEGVNFYPLAQLHLIGPEVAALPDEETEDGDAKQLTLSEALRHLSRPEAPKRTRASPALQSAALEPMRDFVSFSNGAVQPYSNIHRALAYLPSKDVAALLQSEPQLCAQAIGALDGLSADPIDRRVIARMERFGPLLRPEASAAAVAGGAVRGTAVSEVLAPVPLTQALYALTLFLVFFPPKPHFSQAWRDAVSAFRSAQAEEGEASGAGSGAHPDEQAHPAGAKIVEIDDEAERREQEASRGVEEGRWRDIGAKLVCGLELLYARARSRQNKAQQRPSSRRRDAAETAEAQDEYDLAKVADLIDTYLPSASTSSSAGSSGPPLHKVELADPQDSLEELLAQESSSDWLKDMTDPTLDPRDDGVEEGGGEEDALERLRSLMQGTTEFIEEGEGDYRGARFKNEGAEDESEETEDEQMEDNDEQASAKHAQQRRDDLASALDAVPRDGLDSQTAPLPSAQSVMLSSSSTSAGTNDCRHHRLMQDQVRADAKLLKRDKHDGVSEDEEGGGSEDDDEGRAGQNDGSAQTTRVGERSEAEQRAEWSRALRLDELPIRPKSERGRAGAGAGARAEPGVSDSEDDEGGARRKADDADAADDMEMHIPHGPGFGADGSDQVEDEMASFLAFTRKELGIDDALWTRIQADRRRDGRYLPPDQNAKKGPSPAAQGSAADGLGVGDSAKKPKVRFDGIAKGFLNKKRSEEADEASEPSGPGLRKSKRLSASAQVKASESQQHTGAASKDSDGHGTSKGKGKDKDNSSAQDDDGFYALMDQMDAELAKAKRGGPKAQSAASVQTQSKGKGKAANARAHDVMEVDSDDDDGDEDEDADDDDDDELDAQDSELLSKLLSAQGDAMSRAGVTLNPDSGGANHLDAEMLANFLESLRAQGGASGPVSNLAGRLGVGRLPRDAGGSG